MTINSLRNITSIGNTISTLSQRSTLLPALMLQGLYINATAATQNLVTWREDLLRNSTALEWPVLPGFMGEFMPYPILLHQIRCNLSGIYLLQVNFSFAAGETFDLTLNIINVDYQFNTATPNASVQQFVRTEVQSAVLTGTFTFLTYLNQGDVFWFTLNPDTRADWLNDRYNPQFIGVCLSQQYTPTGGRTSIVWAKISQSIPINANTIVNLDYVPLTISNPDYQEHSEYGTNTLAAWTSGALASAGAIFTAQFAGTYFVGANIIFDNVSTTGVRRAWFQTTNPASATVTVAAAKTVSCEDVVGNRAIALHTVMYLQAGATITLYCHQNTGAARPLIVTGANNPNHQTMWATLLDNETYKGYPRDTPIGNL